MQFSYLGVNYKDAQLDIRGKAAFTDVKKLTFCQRAAEAGVEQCMPLSTCNRSEVFYLHESDGQSRQMQKIYEEMFQEAVGGGCVRSLTGEAAMAYLFRIAAGLESLVLGEDQILGQVREAFEDARAMGHCGKELHRAVQDAIACAKRVKASFKISEKPLSVSYIGIQKLRAACGIAGKRILVIGSGKAAALALQYLFEFPDVSVVACSRTYAHASRLREAFPKTEIIPYGQWRQAIGGCDAVISATASPHLIIKKEDLLPTKPMALLDLAAPRDIDASLGEHPLVTLLDLDSLQAIAVENQKEREALAQKSKALIDEKARETLHWLRHCGVDSTIASLQQRCCAIAEDSFSYLSRKMEFTSREQALLRKVLNASLLRLLREPIRELKQIDGKEEQEECKRLMDRLFHLTGEQV